LCISISVQADSTWTRTNIDTIIEDTLIKNGCAKSKLVVPVRAVIDAIETFYNVASEIRAV